MAQFDYFAGAAGYMLDVQADLMDRFNTRIVVPLLPLTQAPTPARRLNPVFRIAGDEFMMATQFLAAIPASELTAKLGSLAHERSQIKAAVDMLFDGF